MIAGLTHLCFLYEFGDDNRMFFGNGHSAGQEFLKVAIAVRNVHGRSAQNVGGTDQAGIPDRLTELHGRLQEWKERR